MLKVLFRCLRLVQRERWRFGRRLDPFPRPTYTLGLLPSCAKSFAKAKRTGCTGARQTSDPAPRKSRGAPTERGIPAGGGRCQRRPHPQGFRPAVPWALADPGIRVVGGGVHG